MSDRLPVCEMCRNFPGEYNFCPITARCCRDDYLYESCSDFEQKALPTLFHRITASPETLAEKFVIKERNQFGGSSYKAILLVDENGNCRDFYSREKAIAATVARLKEVCNE